MDLIEQAPHLQLVGRDHRLGFADDRAIEAKPLGNRQGVGAAREADGQTIGWAQRLHIELNARVAGPQSRMRKCLELGVVGGHQYRDRQTEERGQNRTGQRRAFLRIGAGPDRFKKRP